MLPKFKLFVEYDGNNHNDSSLEKRKTNLVEDTRKALTYNFIRLNPEEGPADQLNNKNDNLKRFILFSA